MRLVTFDAPDPAPVTGHVGVLSEDRTAVVDLTVADPSGPFASMRHLIAAGPDALERAAELLAAAPAGAMRPLAELRLRAPLPDPVRLRDATLFTEHLQPAFRALARQAAAGADDPDAEYERLVATGRYDLPAVLREQPADYNGNHLAVSGPEDVVVAPSSSRSLDYELELGVVIGRSGRDIAPEDAISYVLGYTIFNDWSLRDVQARVMAAQLGPGESKDFDGGTTLGPCIATPDELGDDLAVAMTARVNGEVWSRGGAATMAHPVAGALAHLSAGRTLFAGEVIGSGTVLGGSGLELGRRLNDGDVVELEVEGIGVLRNTVRYGSPTSGERL